MTRQSLIDRRHYSPVRCGWLLPFCALAFAASVEIQNVAPQLPHGVSRADDPNEEAEKLDAGSSASALKAVATAAKPKARGVAPSVSDDRAGTSITAGATPLWGVDGRGMAYVIERNPPWPLTEFKIIFTNERR